jgi:hypothetical protein
MKINITVKKDSIDVQAFDSLYAYLQSLSAPNYKPNIEVKFDAPYTSEDYNILCDYMPDTITEHELTTYDLIFLCNGGEPLTVTSDAMNRLIGHEKVYFITESYLNQSHSLHDKIICLAHNVQHCRDFWTRRFYPQYFENMRNRSVARQSKLIAINGTSRANRYWFFELLKTHVPSIQQLSNIGTRIRKLNNAFCESPEDQQFRTWINNQYLNNSVPEPDQYYNKEIGIGIDNKFGTLLPGYFIMPEYFEYACVIFPESSWLNEELALTEKACKCFYAGSLPFSVGGSLLNQNYNEIGFYTAWNLLPDDLKKFDQIKDHAQRYQQCIHAIRWLNDHPEVFETQTCHDMVDHNRTKFLTCDCDQIAIGRLYDLVRTKLLVDRNFKI